MDFKDIEDIKSASVRTFSSEKKAKNTVSASWMRFKESDFDEGGELIVVPIMETLEEI